MQLKLKNLLSNNKKQLIATLIATIIFQVTISVFWFYAGISTDIYWTSEFIIFWTLLWFVIPVTFFTMLKINFNKEVIYYEEQ